MTGCETSKERDAETGLDYFGARYFSGAQGRFTSPDEPFADQNFSYPQSWNLYAYGRNNPLRFFDLDGRKCVQTDGGGWATQYDYWLGRPTGVKDPNGVITKISYADGLDPAERGGAGVPDGFREQDDVLLR